jgi:hypothetical protein
MREIRERVRGSRELPKRLMSFLGLLAKACFSPWSLVRNETRRSASPYLVDFRTMPSVLRSIRVKPLQE